MPEPTTINTDILALLMQHQTYHDRLADGEFLPDSGSFDELLANEQFRPLIRTIGLKGVYDLIHFVHELAIQVFKDAERHDPDEVAAVQRALLRVVEWTMIAQMSGRL